MPRSRPIDVAALYDAHAELVWKALHRFGVRTADAPDLLQEVFLVAHRRRAEIDGSRPVAPFLWGIALGLARNYRRRAFRRAEELSDAADLCGHEDDALERRELRRRIGRALDTLEPEKRAVFVMFEMEGLAGAAIAELTGVPLGTVHSRLHAARRELSSLLGEDEGALGEAPLDRAVRRST